jgi:hypothetical protein
MMATALTAIAAILTGIPITAITLVSVASRFEDRAWAIAGAPPSTVSALARQIVGFYSEGIEWLLHATRNRDRQDRVERPQPKKTAA